MDGRIQQRISPLDPGQKSKDVNQLKVKDPTKAVEGDENKVDFKSLILNSNRDLKKKNQAVKNGDLSGAESYEDFLESLNKQTKQGKLPKNNLSKDDFLTLFVTQLQAQDPLNPKDGAEMASQLAQFNSLEQMLKMNTGLETLSNKTSEGHALQYINFIGKEVSVSDGRVKIDHGTLSNSTFNVAMPVGRSIMEVRDNQGKVVATKELGALDAGEHKISWDRLDQEGKTVEDGIYSFSVKIYGKNNQEMDAPISSCIKITGVDMKDPSSSFYTEFGKIGMADISEIGIQGFNDNAKIKELKPKKTAPAPKNLEVTNAQSKTASGTIATKEGTSSKNAFHPEIQAPFTAVNALKKYEQNQARAEGGQKTVLAER